MVSKVYLNNNNTKSIYVLNKFHLDDFCHLFFKWFKLRGYDWILGWHSWRWSAKEKDCLDYQRSQGITCSKSDSQSLKKTRSTQIKINQNLKSTIKESETRKFPKSSINKKLKYLVVKRTNIRPTRSISSSLTKKHRRWEKRIETNSWEFREKEMQIFPILQRSRKLPFLPSNRKSKHFTVHWMSKQKI